MSALLPFCPATPVVTVPAPVIVSVGTVVEALSPLKDVTSLVKVVPPPIAPYVIPVPLCQFSTYPWPPPVPPVCCGLVLALPSA